MRCKIVKFKKLMYRNIMRSTKSQKVSVLHYSIDYMLSYSYLIVLQKDNISCIVRVCD